MFCSDAVEIIICITFETDNGFVLLCALLSLFLVSNSCHNLSIEAQKIGSFLYEDDYLIRGEGQRFLALILNKPLKITAMDFFKLERSFFASVSKCYGMWGNDIRWRSVRTAGQPPSTIISL